jgi:23S rRNA pseudouridine1911/1915/1917 synthase
LKLEILHEDDSVVAINKPAGVASVPSAGEELVASRLIGQQVGLPSRGDIDRRIRPVHRIDKDTSGVLLFAKSRSAQQFFSHQFQNNQVEKVYHAIVAGEARDREGTIDAPMGRHPRDPIKMQVDPRGKPAVTFWKLLQRFRRHALIEARPRTGKTHQIRVHLSSIGLPLAIDPLYGRPPVKPRVAGAEVGIYLSTFKRDYNARPDGQERPLIARLTLHASELKLKQPDGTELHLIAPQPKDFRAAVNMLSKYSS